MIKFTKGKHQQQIIKEWDNIAKLRMKQMLQDKDLSYSFILVPTIYELSKKSDFAHVIDVGCGPGHLVAKLGKKARRIVGVDASKVNIDLANNCYSKISNAVFVNSTIESFVYKQKKSLFTLGIANMSLMSMLNLPLVLKSIAKVLKRRAHFIFTISHPCYWPWYWGYASEAWFDYKKEICIEAPFKISLEQNCDKITTHIHRPLEQYLSSLIKAGFLIDKVLEPMPAKIVEKKYPKPWGYPRFLAVRCIKK